MRNKETLLAIGNALRVARETKGLSQDALAARLGISSKTIANAENCKFNAKMDTILLIAAELDVSLDRFYRPANKLPNPLQARILLFFSDFNDDEATRLLEFTRKNADYVVERATEDDK